MRFYLDNLQVPSQEPEAAVKMSVSLREEGNISSTISLIIKSGFCPDLPVDFVVYLRNLRWSWDGPGHARLMWFVLACPLLSDTCQQHQVEAGVFPGVPPQGKEKHFIPLLRPGSIEFHRMVALYKVEQSIPYPSELLVNFCSRK